MAYKNQNQRLNGFTPLAYIGVNAIQPTNFTSSDISPSTEDSRGFNLGDWWLNTTDSSMWYLAESNGLTATWISISGSSSTGFLEITGNTGGPVLPINQNINVVGDDVTVDVAGDPGTSTLTASLLPAVPTKLTGNTGGAVSPTAGNINVVGDGNMTVTDTPGTNTMTVNTANAIATSFVTQSGTAVPSAGVLNIFGSNGILTSGAGSTVTITAGPSISDSYVTSPATGTATPSAGVLTFAGTGTTTVSATGSTVTISNTPSSPTVSYSEGSFTPFITVNGVNTGTGYFGRAGYYVQIGNVVYLRVFLSAGTIIGGATGFIGVGGLPYVSPNVYGVANGNFSWLTQPNNIQESNSSLVGKMVMNTNYLQLYFYNVGTNSSTGTTAIPSFPGSGPFNFTLQGFYFI